MAQCGGRSQSLTRMRKLSSADCLRHYRQARRGPSFGARASSALNLAHLAAEDALLEGDDVLNGAVLATRALSLARRRELRNRSNLLCTIARVWRAYVPVTARSRSGAERVRR
eukprot:3885096-Pleurochrysis_carterae.AAC.2